MVIIAALVRLAHRPANRRALTTRPATEMERARREPHGLVVVLVDLDYFEGFNDTCGHAAGDHLPCTASGQWRALLRTSEGHSR